MSNGFQFKLVKNNQYIQCVSYPSEADLSSLRYYFNRMDTTAYRDYRYKRGMWDGKRSFINKDGLIRFELWDEIKKFLVKEGYGFRFSMIEGLQERLNMSFKVEEVHEFAEMILPDGFKLRPYQAEAIQNVFKYKYCSQHLATASGKTIISYMSYAYMRKHGIVSDEKKFLLIVPTTDLVLQTYEKFTDTYKTDRFYSKIEAIHKDIKTTDHKLNMADCIIVNYQSIHKISQFIKDINVVNIDEAHTDDCTTIVNFMDEIRKDHTLQYQFGWSGTFLKDEEFAQFWDNKMQLGPLVKIYRTRNLIDDGYAPEVNIRTILLDYKNRSESWIKEYTTLRNTNGEGFKDKLQFFDKLYELGSECLLNDEVRVNAIIDIASKLDKNTLILYNDSKNGHGDKICKGLEDLGKTIMQIDGKTKSKTRKKHIDTIEESEGVFMACSYGTFATGIDTKNVFYVIFAEPYRSVDRIGQSIGRLLRALMGKKLVVVIDIVDLLYKHTESQYKGRKEKIYDVEKYKITEEVRCL